MHLHAVTCARQPSSCALAAMSTPSQGHAYMFFCLGPGTPPTPLSFNERKKMTPNMKRRQTNSTMVELPQTCGKARQSHDYVVEGPYEWYHHICLYSATLTAFLVESYQRLQEDPSETSVILLKQSVSLLAQISQQLAPNGSQVNRVVLPEPVPTFTVTRADQTINALWFSSLILSISAVLAATIVQQWAEYRMQVFERLTKAIPCSRIRHFLHEGTINWIFNHVVATIPGLIHVALWLFFIGLAVFLFSINTIVASVASAVLLFTSLAYLSSTVLPLLSPQSPYQTPFSNVLWWLLQTIRARYSATSFSPDLFNGRTQMVMKVASGRGQRDAEALSWIMESPMSDAEFEHFIDSIPTSARSMRGQRLWDRVGYTPVFRNYLVNTSSPDPWPTSNKDVPVHPLGDLASRIDRFLEGCFDPSFLDGTRRQQRAHAGVCAILSLTFTGATRHRHPHAFGVQWDSLIRSRRLTRTLSYLSFLNPVGALRSDSGADEMPVARWICMSILSVGTLLANIRLEDEFRRVQQEFRSLKQEGREELVGEVEVIWSALTPLKAKLWSLALSDDPQERSRISALSEEFAARCVISADPEFPSPLNDHLWTMFTTRMQDRTDGLIQRLPGAVIEDLSEVPATNGYHLTHMMSPSLLAMSLKQWAQRLGEIARDGNASQDQRFHNCRSHMSLLDTYEDAKRWLPMQRAIFKGFHYHNDAMLYRLALLVTTSKP
ncbi:hypothetical protein EVG20_g2986 [Dentipellis fragilis]|uniref:DUF6535 domain-containing protein n=1 Tax=Dentipellis fragilis TaxID=205917 RepID=A0A4Y9Z5Q4_9AGAM|nr:hypothetical protein EVG20_g2986 [Dentipellis fragilis]